MSKYARRYYDGAELKIEEVEVAAPTTDATTSGSSSSIGSSGSPLAAEGDAAPKETQQRQGRFLSGRGRLSHTTADAVPSPGTASTTTTEANLNTTTTTTTLGDEATSNANTSSSPASDGGADAATATSAPGGPTEESISAEEDDILIDDVDDEDVDDNNNADNTTETGASTTTTTTIYSCDVCSHLVFLSREALHQHALQHHSDLVPDYSKLHAVAQKLRPHWSQVLDRKRDVLTQWGKKVFHIAEQRDAGAEKMAEAHRAREQLELVVRRWHPTASVYMFGSSVTFGVWDGISDIDFTVVDVASMEAGTWPPPERNAVRSLTELLRRAGFSFVNLEPIAHARVPIIKHHASSPIRVDRSMLPSSLRAAAAGGDMESEHQEGTKAKEHKTLLEAEHVISRSVRYTLSAAATPQDRAVLEGSIRDAVGAANIQQVWWNRTGEMMCVTCSTTTHAVRAATCPLSFATPTLRARVQPLHDECRPELHDIDFDLSFRSFGIRNSDLLRRYLQSHPCARPGAIVLKDWSKTSGVNNSVNGFLTSYAVNIMWIYYLVQKGVVPYVDPDVDVPASLRDNTQYAPDYCAMVNPQWTMAELEAHYHEAGALLLGFFHYYAFEFNWADHVVSLNRREVTTKRMLGWDAEDINAPSAAQLSRMKARQQQQEDGAAVANDAAASQQTAAAAGGRRNSPTRYAFCIEDPYEENLNLGRHMGVTKSLRVQAEFYRGMLSLLKDGEFESCVFAATDRAELQHKQQQSSEGQLLSGNSSKNKSNQKKKAPSAAGGGLPFKVLYRLMAVALTEFANEHQRRRSLQATTQTQTQQEQQLNSTSSASPPVSDSTAGSNTTTTTAVGVDEKALRRAFESQAPTELELALKAWNWQQLLHRLGYKRHDGVVLPRREMGMRRIPPRGVLPCVPTDHHEPAVAASAADTIKTAAEEAQARMHGLARGLSEHMITVLSEGFMRLTPEWISWATPWAALHTRGNVFFTGAPRAATAAAAPPPPSSEAVSSSNSNRNSAAMGTASSATVTAALHESKRRYYTALPTSTLSLAACMPSQKRNTFRHAVKSLLRR